MLFSALFFMFLSTTQVYRPKIHTLKTSKKSKTYSESAFGREILPCGVVFRVQILFTALFLMFLSSTQVYRTKIHTLETRKNTKTHSESGFGHEILPSG